MKQAVLVIDPLSSAKYLTDRFHALGFAIIALRTLVDVDDYFSYEDLPFEKILQSSKNLATDVEMLRTISDYKLIHGFTGIIACVPYAEQLLAKLFPEAANNPHTSNYRFDKFFMNEILKKNKLSYIKQQKLTTKLSLSEKIASTVKFFKEHKGNIVIKPCSGSAGSVGVFSPTTITDISLYYHNQHHGVFFESDLLLQEKINGTEYYIDAVAYQGQQQIVSIGRYTKQEINGLFTYQYTDSIDKNIEQTQALQQYVLTCLEKLQVNNGFSHTEIIATANEFRPNGQKFRVF